MAQHSINPNPNRSLDPIPLADESFRPTPSPGVMRLPNEPLIERGSGETYDLAPASEAVAARLITAKELTEYLTKIGPDGAAVARHGERELLALFSKGVELLSHLELAPAVHLKDGRTVAHLNSHVLLAEKAATELEQTFKLLNGLFTAPHAVVKAFALDSARRVATDPGSAAFVVDQVDRARIAAILATGVGLHEHDTVLGGRGDERRDVFQAQAPKEKKPLIQRLTPEQKRAAAEAKKQKIFGTAQGPEAVKTPEEAPPEAPTNDTGKTAPEPGYEETLSHEETADRRARLDDSRPTEVHAPFRATIPPQLPPGMPRSAETPRILQDLQRDRVYSAVAALSTWFLTEINLHQHEHRALSVSRIIVDPAASRARAAEVRVRLAAEGFVEDALHEKLTEALRMQARVINKIPGLAQRVTNTKEQERLAILGAKGMDKIRLTTPVVSLKVVEAARHEQLRREQERAAERENWILDRWKRDEGASAPPGQDN